LPNVPRSGESSHLSGLILLRITQASTPLTLGIMMETPMQLPTWLVGYTFE